MSPEQPRSANSALEMFPGSSGGGLRPSDFTARPSTDRLGSGERATETITLRQPGATTGARTILLVLVRVPEHRDTPGLAVGDRAAAGNGEGAEGVVRRQRHEDVVVPGVGRNRVGGPRGVLRAAVPRPHCRDIERRHQLQHRLVTRIDYAEGSRTLRRLRYRWCPDHGD